MADRITLWRIALRSLEPIKKNKIAVKGSHLPGLHIKGKQHAIGGKQKLPGR